MTPATSPSRPPGTRQLHPEHWETQPSGAVRLLASRCTRCGATYLPAIATCASCRGREFTSQPLSHSGTLYSYTIVRDAGGAWPDVYAIGYVDFPENVRVCGHLRETSDAQLRVGMPMGVEAAELYRDKDGSAVVCFRFHRLEGAGR
jgi:uncharacterized protein